MRLTYRAAGLLALAVVAITCTDAPTGPGHRAGFNSARLGLAPSFSPAAERAYGALETMGIAVTQVRIRLRAADGTLARDTTIQFGAEDTLHLQLAVEIQGTEQTFSALFELTDASGAVLFSQAQNVIARASALPAAPPTTITLEYVGPGATARSLSITPTDLTVQAGVEPVLTAVGTDAAGGPVTNLLLGWTSSDATIATLTAVGRVATVHGTGRRGAVTITATTPTGLAGTARLTMLPLAARLVVIAGDVQTSVAGRLLAQPLVVELQGADGGPIPGATVTFRALAASAAVGTATATTDTAGRASTTLTLGQLAGAYAFEAASGTVPPVTVAATATAAPAVALSLVSGDGQADSIGTALAPLVVRATNEFGATVTGASITWERLAGLGTLGASTTTTGADGLSSTSYVLGLLPGADTLRATIAGVTGAGAAVRFITKSIARGPNAIAITSSAQSGLPGTTLAAPLVAQVTDARGNRLPGVNVQWQSSVAGLVTFATPLATTDANGEARTAVTLGSAVGSTTVTANVGPLNARTTVSVLVGAAASLTAVGGSGPGTAGGTTVLRARVTDAAGNPVAGYAVTWAITAGGGSLPFSTSTTNVLGDAEITWTLGFLVGAQTATATASGLAGSPALFTVNAAAAAGSLLRVITQPGPLNAPSGVTLATQPVVRLTDATGTPISQAGVTVSAAVTDAQSTLRGTTTAVTDTAGVATFAGLDVRGVAGTTTAIVFAAPGFTNVTSNALSIGPGVPATIAARDLPAGGTVGLPVALPPSVIVRDSTGNPVSGVPVTFAVATGGGSIATPNATTDAGGVATAGSWVLGIVPGTNVVTATSGTLGGSPVSFAAVAQAGPAATMKFISEPTNTVVGATLSIVRVQLLDVYGNVATSSTNAVSLALDPPLILLGGKPTVNAVAGVATFLDLFVGVANSFRLKASSAQLPDAFSAPFVIDPLPIQVGRIRPLANRNQLVPIRGVLPKDSVAFVVEDLNAKPLAGVLVSFRLASLSGCALEQRDPIVTGTDGIVATAVMAGDRPGACEVTAVAGEAQETAKIAVYATSATHVWFGGTVNVDHYYDVNGNWLSVSGGKGLVPTSRDTAFVPNWRTNMGPQLLADAALGGLLADKDATVDLGKFTLTTGTVSAEGARVLNGLVIATGDARVSGEFERLDVGRVDCQGDKATLETVIVRQLRVLCIADVVKQADVGGSIDVAARAVLTVTGALVAKAPATLRLFDGASLIVDGTASLGGCTQTLAAIIAGKGTINGLPALEFLGACKP